MLAKCHICLHNFHHRGLYILVIWEFCLISQDIQKYHKAQQGKFILILNIYSAAYFIGNVIIFDETPKSLQIQKFFNKCYIWNFALMFLNEQNFSIILLYLQNYLTNKGFLLKAFGSDMFKIMDESLIWFCQ